MNNTFFILSVLLVAMSILLLIGGIFGRENVIEGDTNLFTYPFRLYFRKKWKTLLYRIVMGGLMIACCGILTQRLLPFTGPWVALLVPVEVLAVIILSYILSVGLLLLVGFFIFLIYGWQKDN